MSGTMSPRHTRSGFILSEREQQNQAPVKAMETLSENNGVVIDLLDLDDENEGEAADILLIK